VDSPVRGGRNPSEKVRRRGIFSKGDFLVRSITKAIPLTKGGGGFDTSKHKKVKRGKHPSSLTLLGKSHKRKTYKELNTKSTRGCRELRMMRKVLPVLK